MHLFFAGCAMKIIYTRKGEEILVDDEDYERLNRWMWHLNAKGYAIRFTYVPGAGRKKRVIFMHRLIMNVEFGDPRQVDHKYGVKTDNRKSELRVCVQQQNLCNVTIRSDNSSGYKGVFWNKETSRWRAVIRANNKRVHLGYFDTPEDAHRVYCAAAQRLHGEFANYGAHLSDNSAQRELVIIAPLVKAALGE